MTSLTRMPTVLKCNYFPPFSCPFHLYGWSDWWLWNRTTTTTLLWQTKCSTSAEYLVLRIGSLTLRYLLSITAEYAVLGKSFPLGYVLTKLGKLLANFGNFFYRYYFIYLSILFYYIYRNARFTCISNLNLIILYLYYILVFIFIFI